MPSTYGAFDTRIDVESALKSRGSSQRLGDLALPASHDDVLLLAHPWFAPTFAASIDPGWSADRLNEFALREVDLVLGATDDWKIHVEYVGTGELGGARVDRVLITCLPLTALLLQELLHCPTLQVRSTVGVVAEVLIRRAATRLESERPWIAVGWYSGRAEICAVHRGSLHCVGYVAFESIADGWNRVATFIETFFESFTRQANLLLYGHLEGESIHPPDAVFDVNRPIDRLQPADLFETGGQPVVGDALYGLTAAGAYSHLISEV